MQTTIRGFFNPTKVGDTFRGLNSTIDGEVAEKPISSLFEFLKAAGRDYSVDKVPAGILDPSGAIDDRGNVVPGWIKVGNQYHLARSSDHRVVSPHTVTDQYAPISFLMMAEELQPWCDAGWCSPDGVYSGKGESLELLSLRLDAAGELPDGEKFSHYIVFRNPHGSGGKPSGTMIDFRIICGNTFARANARAAHWTITHRMGAGTQEEQASKMQERAEKAVKAWEQVREHIAALASRIQSLKSVNVSSTQAETFANRLLGIVKTDKETSGRARNKRDAILQAFTMPSMGTYGRNAWDLSNAVTFVNSSPLADLNKKSKVSGLDRLIRNVEPNGTGAAFEERANELLAEMIG